MMRCAWVLPLLAGCGAQIANGGDAGGGPGGKGDGTSLTPSSFLTKLGDNECDEAFMCRASFPATSNHHFEDDWGSTTDECYAGAADYFMPAGVEASVAAGKIKFDASAAKSCLAGIDYGSCSHFWKQGPDYPSACGSALVGTVPEGGDCASDFECTGDDVCDSTAETCQPPARKEPGLQKRVAMPHGDVAAR